VIFTRELIAELVHRVVVLIDEEALTLKVIELEDHPAVLEQVRGNEHREGRSLKFVLESAAVKRHLDRERSKYLLWTKPSGRAV
jgi:hypothetical protein